MKQRSEELSAKITGQDLFELDGNAVEEATAGDDWETLYMGGGSAAGTTAIPISDKGLNSGTALLDAIFKSASDVNDISTWNWVVADANKPGALPPKDNTTNAYAAAYTHGDDLVIFFGQDRFAANGTSDIGFWFLQERVGMKPSNPACPATQIGCTGVFEGKHKVGDILILSAFTQGGQVDSIEILEWVGSGGNAGGGTMRLVHKGTAADCATVPDGSPACAIVNRVNATSPWTYLAQENGSVPGVFPSRHFFEGGVNLTQLGIRRCFSTFLSETRSSSSLTAQLKDFAMGEFDVCSIDLDKTGDALSKIGDEVTYQYTITNTGALAMQLKSLVDDQIGNLAAYVPAACNVLAPSASCVVSVPWIIPSGAPDPYRNVATVEYIEEGGDVATSAAYSDTDDHTVNLFQPQIALAKTGDALSKAGDPIHYRITFNNLSSADAPALECTIVDAQLGLSEQVTVASGGTVELTPTYIVKDTDPDPLVNTATVTCSPQGFPNVLTASATHSTNLFQPRIALEKTGDTLSKIGDPVSYTITLRNLSSADSPVLNCALSDPMLGISKQLSIASGQADTTVAAYLVKAGDPDPLVNTASVICSPDGFPNILTANASHSVNLFQPSIDLVKGGDALSKIGDPVQYELTLHNTSSADSPDLVCVISDPLLGFTRNVTLAAGASDTSTPVYVVQEGDPDPLVNTASATCSPVGFPNILTDTASHSVNLFQPSLTFDKSGDTLSKATDPANFVITLNNTSSADSPDLVCTIVDAMLGITQPVTLGSGQSYTINSTYIVQHSDPDPLVNSASVTCSPVGFPNVLAASDSHSVNLFQPSITFDKSGDDLSKIGDPVNYQLLLTNTSSADSPDLVCTIVDAMLGISQQVTLASGASRLVEATYVVQATDADPLVNTASATCSPQGFPNVLTASDSHSVNLFQPSIAFAKTGDALSKATDPVNFEITLINTSSADSPDLVCTISDPMIGFSKDVTLASGASDASQLQYVVQASDPDPLVNTATVACSPIGFPNVLTASASHSVNLFQPAMSLEKTGDLLSKIGDPVNYVITLRNESSADAPELNCTVLDAMLGIDQQISLGSGQVYTINASYTVQASDSDPLINVASAQCSPAGFPNVLTDSDAHSVNLFQPSVVLDKTGDALSKATDPVNFTLTVRNTSSADSPDLNCVLADPLIGLNQAMTLASGAEQVVNAVYVVQGSDPDPLVNTASVTCSPSGFPNVLVSSDSHSVNLFQPSMTLGKVGPAYSKAGDTANYVITLSNTSSADAPALVCTVTDPLLNLSVDVTLASGQSASIPASYVVQAGDQNPLVNTAFALCSPQGFPNVLRASASWSTQLLHPSWTISKTCLADPVIEGQPAGFRVTIANTGDADLVFAISDPSMASINGTYALAVGQSRVLEGVVAYVNGQGSVSNTVNAVITLASGYQLDNTYQDSASATCALQPNWQGCTPGGWRNLNGRGQLWDSPSDPLAITVGFYTGTSFHSYFGLTPAQTGLPSGLTMYGGITLGGGGPEKLARHGVAGLLNAGAGLYYMYPPGTSDLASLRTAIRNAYLNGAYEPLASQLAMANDQTCPVDF